LFDAFEHVEQERVGFVTDCVDAQLDVRSVGGRDHALELAEVGRKLTPAAAPVGLVGRVVIVRLEEARGAIAHDAD